MGGGNDLLGPWRYLESNTQKLAPNGSPIQDIQKVKEPSRSDYSVKANALGTNPSGNPGSSSSPDGDPSFNPNFEEWSCPKIPDSNEIISNKEFWNALERENSLNKKQNICEETDLEDEEEDFLEELENEYLRDQEEIPRVSSALAGPIPTPASAPTPTGKLDRDKIQQFDLRSDKYSPPYLYQGSHGENLSLTRRGLGKVIYAHSSELGLTNFADNIQCPIQLDPNKYQRQECRAITDRSQLEAIEKIVKMTTEPRYNSNGRTQNNIVTVVMPMPFYNRQEARAFIDTTTGLGILFHEDKNPKTLWSVFIFPEQELLDTIIESNSPLSTRIRRVPDQ